MGRRRHVDSIKTEPHRREYVRRRSPPAFLVFSWTFEAGSFAETSRSGFDRAGETAGQRLPEKLPKTVYRQRSAFDGFGRRGIPEHSLYRFLRGRFAAADRLRKRGESASGQSDNPGKRVCHPLGAGREPLAVGTPTPGGERDPGAL